MSRCVHDLEGITCAICHPRGDITPARRGRPLLTAGWADQLVSWIPAIGADWISRDDLAEVSGLSPEQVSRAVAWLRDNSPELPLVSGPEGYRFSLSEQDIARYKNSALKTAKTRIRRAWTGVIRPYLDHIDSADTRLITKQFERLVEDIEELT